MGVLPPGPLSNNVYCKNLHGDDFPFLNDLYSLPYKDLLQQNLPVESLMSALKPSAAHVPGHVGRVGLLGNSEKTA